MTKSSTLKLVFHPDYLKYDFGGDHPFWPERAKIFLEILPRSLDEDLYQVVKPTPASDSDILLVHSAEYLAKVKKLARESGWLSPDTPLNLNVLQAAYASVGGSILAGQLALRGEPAINLLGGLHHAGKTDSSGFCVFNDHAIAVRHLQKKGQIKKAFILDLDVHAGQGTQEIFYDDPSVFTVSLHQDPTTLYPGTGFPWQKGRGPGLGFNLNVIFPPGTEEEKYLTAIDQILPRIDVFQPDLVVVVLGVDTFKDDPLASLSLTETAYGRIGGLIGRLDFAKFICFAGGYSPKVPDLWMGFIEGLISDPPGV